MPRFSNEPLSSVRQRLFDGMADYLRAVTQDGGNSGPYTQTDIDECISVVDRYLAALPGTAAKGQGAIERVIRDTVQQLNALNARCDGALIETDQREDLCQIILVAARQAGLQTLVDVTEAWREW